MVAIRSGRWVFRGVLGGLVLVLGLFVARSLGVGLTKRVDDRAGYLDPAELPRFDTYLQRMHDESGVDIRFLFVDSVAGTLEDFALQQARALGIGRDIDRRGVLFAYDVRRHQLRVEVGPNLEPIFTDRFVGYLMRNHVRSFFAAGNPTFGLRLTLFMLHARLRRAALGEEYNPQAAEYIEARERLALGGGASARMPKPGEGAGFLNADTDTMETRLFQPQATIEATYGRYLEWLRSARFLPGVTLFTPASQAYLSRLPMTLAFKDYILFLEYGQPHVIVERGDLGLLYFTSDPLACPHFFRRTSAGWQLDMVAEVQNTRNFAGGPFTWGYLDRGDDFSRAFSDQLVQVGPILRLRGGDNRSLRTLN